MSSTGAQNPPSNAEGNAFPLWLGGFFLVCLSAVSFGAMQQGLHGLAILAVVAWISGGMLLFGARREGNHRWLAWAFIMYTLAAGMFAAAQVDSIAWNLFGAIALTLALTLTRASLRKSSVPVG